MKNGGNSRNAARCYEKAGMYEDASRLFETIGDKEGVSRATEGLGDLDKALNFAQNADRKFNLLIRMEKFLEAREFAAGLESPNHYFEIIKIQARNRLEVKVQCRDFIGAMELADFADCDLSRREEILASGRQYYDRQIASATTDDEIKSIYQEKVKLEEKAGHFEDAGRMAEEVLQDFSLASILYEKANLFNRAIETASTGLEEKENRNDARIRLAELQESGGNLLKAAKLYEAAGSNEKASALFEKIEQFQMALACYLKTPNPREDVLIQLYSGAGEYEKMVEIYMQRGAFPDLEQALSIARTHNLTSHKRVIENRMAGLMSGNEKDLERCFNKARKQVLDSYPSIIGIDFGTTNSVVAIFNKSNETVEIIPNTKGVAFEPSFFGVDENNHPIFGEAARLRSLVAPECVVARVKRSLGEKGGFIVNGKSFTSEEIVAKIIHQLRLNAESYLNSKEEEYFYRLLEKEDLRFPEAVLREFLTNQKGSRWIVEVVLSVPAYFNDIQKRATRDSAEIAGLHVRRLLHEPTAAALAYGYQKPYSGTLAVVDLGGGTLDISIVDIGEGVYEVQTVDGDTKLGGSDIDALLVAHVIKNITDSRGIVINEKTYPIEIARLRDACENMKINLSSVNQYTMELAHFLNKPKYIFRMTRSELDELSKPILERFKATIERAIKNYPSKLDHYLLVGNATKMPVIGEQIRKIITAKQLKGIDPGTVVATGAALDGAILSGVLEHTLLLDIVPYSLGISVMKKESGPGETEMSRLIARNTIIPTSKSEIYSTKEDNQPNVHIKVYQGESPHPEKNYFLGDFILEGIRLAPAGTPKIEVTFEIGADCILTVTALDKESNHKRSIKLEGAVGLSPFEKQTLGQLFAQNDNVNVLEKNLEEMRKEIEAKKTSFNEAMLIAERLIRDFSEHFHEKVELNARYYQSDLDQAREIQNMYIQKDQIINSYLIYRDQFATITNNVRQTEARYLDFSDKEIVTKLQERVNTLSKYKAALGTTKEALEMNVITPLENWMRILGSLEPNIENMRVVEVANYHFTGGRVNKARELLENLTSGSEGLTKEAFLLLLRCYVRLGLKEEYRNLHKRLGNLFGIVYPDFNRLNTFLKTADNSVFMIKGISQKQEILYGSGFCISPNLIVTNRHVVETTMRPNIKSNRKKPNLYGREARIGPRR